MLFERLNSGTTTTWKELKLDGEFVELRRNHDPDFEEWFNRAYRAYIAGDWGIASRGIKQLIKLNPNDGPSINLHKVINT